MIKRLIFDIDDTLITWKNEYNNAINKALDDLKYPHTKELCTKINDLELEYEIDRKCFNRAEMLNFINNGLQQELPSKFIDQWIERLKDCVEDSYPKEDYETLKLLSQKYELVALTNWFLENQIERLRKLDILKFFKNVYGPEKYAKPYKDCFLQAVEPYGVNEVAMIGDSFENDIQGAKKAGIKKLVWKDNFNKKQEYKEFLNDIEIIKEVKDLKNIF